MHEGQLLKENNFALIVTFAQIGILHIVNFAQQFTQAQGVTFAYEVFLARGIAFARRQFNNGFNLVLANW